MADDRPRPDAHLDRLCDGGADGAAACGGSPGTARRTGLRTQPVAVDAGRPGPHGAGADTLVIACGVVAALHVGKLPPALPVLRDALLPLGKRVTLAFVFGAVAHKSNYCIMGAVSDVVNMGDWQQGLQGAALTKAAFAEIRGIGGGTPEFQPDLAGCIPPVNHHAATSNRGGECHARRECRYRRS